jgi:AbrB family looped-hinge helix DNA binding protein
MPRMTSKGQVTIPRNIRERFGLLPGQMIEFVVEGDAVVVRRATNHEHLLRWIGTVSTEVPVDEFMDELRGETLDEAE